ncbi:hypothetical protein H4R35_001184 [Dimargaris xerosporica]|nr:hypothetical protein H4R35_001184 [Dimargaris xerosporica]
MANKNTALIYQQVIDEVISAVQKEFEDQGVDESVLQDLQRSWEARLLASNVADFPQVEGVDDDAYQYPESVAPYDQDYQPPPNPPTADDPYTSAAYVSPLGQVMPGGPTVAAANLATFASTPGSATTNPEDPEVAAYGKPQPYMYPKGGNTTAGDYDRRSQQQPTHSLPSGNGSTGGGDGAGYIPQHDGADDLARAQVDGDYDRPASNYPTGYADPSSATGPGAATNATTAIGDEDGDEDAINSDLDDPDDDDINENGAGGDDTEHIILCQYDKVTRQKNRWKCTLKDGIMLIDGKDYLFHKATGEFEW